MRWGWGILLFGLAVLALWRIGGDDPVVERTLGLSMGRNVGWILAFAATSVIALGSLALGMRTGRADRRNLDISFFSMLAIWLALAGSTTWARWASLSDSMAWIWITHVCYQLIIGAVSYQLVSSLTTLSFGGRAIWAVQQVVCISLVSWGLLGVEHTDLAYLAWKVVNVVVTSAFYLRLGRGVLAGHDGAGWLVLVGACVAYVIGTADLAIAQKGLILIGIHHHLFAGYMLLVWLVTSNRISLGGDEEGVGDDHSRLGREFANSALTPYSTPANAPAYLMATNRERRRIAQELHDGVGSQLVSIISGLDRTEPGHRVLASSLEQCLLDVKILVDAIDDSDESVIDALGRLRYRVQHSLDQLGIRLVWDVDFDGPLEQIGGELGRQVLRIAQESMSNVMRHSKASMVWLSCHMDDTGRAMVLEIRDDGVGFDQRLHAGPSTGKGLTGMRRRAAGTGGVLELRSHPGKGTKVTFTMPVLPGRSGDHLPPSPHQLLQ
ncbi:hypothetical protein NBRC116584_01910 [Hydrogenophaga sp. 5NK40-0174]